MAPSPRPSITLDECISRRRRERFEILPRLGARADEQNCNRIGVFFQLAIVERPSASNDRTIRPRRGRFLSFSLSLSLSLSLFKLVGLPRKINLPAFFRPPLRAFSTTDCRFHSLSFFRSLRENTPAIDSRFPRGDLSQSRRDSTATSFLKQRVARSRTDPKLHLKFITLTV